MKENGKIVGLGDPTCDGIATKVYVDGQVSGKDWLRYVVATIEEEKRNAMAPSKR